MNGKRVKRIRRTIYGEDYSPKFREYSGINRRIMGFAMDRVINQVGQITADWRRQAYQQMKRRVYDR